MVLQNEGMISKRLRRVLASVLVAELALARWIIGCPSKVLVSIGRFQSLMKQHVPQSKDTCNPAGFCGWPIGKGLAAVKSSEKTVTTVRAARVLGCTNLPVIRIKAHV
jgi:hypothetical protein